MPSGNRRVGRSGLPLSAGVAAITELLTGYFEGEGLTSEPSDLRGGSDHGPFLQVGAPVGGMYTGSIETMTRQQAEAYGGAAGVMHDACYHQACDTRENVSDAALGQAAGAYVHLLTELTLP